MRSHLKLLLVLAVAMSPTLTLADDPVLTKADRLLSKDEATKMFNEFSVAKSADDKMAVLYGTTSESCMMFFADTNDSEKGEFTITVKKGADERCLDSTKLPKEEDKFVGLSEQEGAKLEFSSTLTKLSLRSENPKSDQNKVVLDDLLVAEEGKNLFTSAKELAEQKKKEALAKVDEKITKDQLLVSSCYRGLTELDIGSEALGRLSKIKSVVDEKGAEWFEKKRKEINARIFAGCQKQIQKGKTDDISGCSERMKQLAETDETYAKKVKDLYFTLVSRYANSSSLTVNDAYDRALEVIALLEGMTLSEEDEKAVALAKKQLIVNGLQKAQFLGESEEFAAMAEKAEAEIQDADGENCLDANGGLNLDKRLPTGAPAAACVDAYRLSAQLQNAKVIAKGLTPALKARAERNAAIAIAAEQKQMKLNQCAAAKIGGLEATAECTALEKAEAAAASATANQGLTGEAFGTVKTETPAADKPAAESDAGIIKSSTAVQDAKLTQTTLVTPVPAPVAPVASVQVTRN